MKTIRFPVAMAILLLLASTPLLYLGCKNLETNTYKATGVVIISVDAAMKAWGDYVRAYQGTVRSVPLDNQRTVKAAYDKYYAAVQLERSAITAYKTGTDTNALIRVLGIVEGASAEVIRLIETFLPPDRLAALKGATP